MAIKILIGIGVLIIVIVGAVFLLPRGGNLNLNQNLASNSVIALSVNSGNLTVNSSNSNTVTGVSNYKGQKPKTTFYEAENIYKVESSDNSKEIRVVNIPNSNKILNAAVGNGGVELNLRSVNSDQISIAIGNGLLKITLPELKSSNVALASGNGNVQIAVPTKIVEGLRLTFPSGQIPEMDLGKDMVKTKDGYEAVNYQKSTIKTDVQIQMGNGNLSITSVE